MDLVNGVHEHMLDRPINVYIRDKNGDVEVSLLTLHEPRREHIKYSSRLKQMVMQAFMSMSDTAGKPGVEVESFHESTNDKKHEEDSVNLAKGLLYGMLMSKEVDLGEFVETFIKMATGGKKNHIVLCDDAVPIKDIHFDQMSEETITNLAIEYAAFFSMPSEMKENFSKQPSTSL